MNWKRGLNVALSRATGYELVRLGARRRHRPPQPGDRLVKAPAFVLCSVRSGSTLLRVLLDSHSQIVSPQELHLRDVGVQIKSDYAQQALQELGLDVKELEYLLWDRVLHRELEESGKQHVVNKTPNDVFITDRILECWPDARFIFLLRHPAAIVRSRQEVRPQDSVERHVSMVLRYGDALERARRTHAGITVRYEELTADPAAVTQRLCAFLGVPWEPQMVDYGRFAHGRYRPGLGDWKEKIRSGRVQPAAPLPAVDEIPAELHGLCAAWGYPPAPTGEGAGATAALTAVTGLATSTPLAAPAAPRDT